MWKQETWAISYYCGSSGLPEASSVYWEIKLKGEQRNSTHSGTNNSDEHFRMEQFNEMVGYHES